MQHLFAVIRTRGPAWQGSDAMENQADWTSHASFMDSLVEGGFVILGGPLEGTSDVLLIVRADSPAEVRSRLRDDPWTTKDLLRITQVTPWTLRLGSLAGDHRPPPGRGGSSAKSRPAKPKPSKDRMKG